MDEQVSQDRQINVSSTLEDIARSHRLVAARQVRGDSQLKWTLYVGATVYLVLTIAIMSFVINRESDHGWVVALAMGSLPLFVACGLFIVLGRIMSKSQLSRYFGPGPFSCWVSLGETHLTYCHEGWEQRFPWGAVDELELHRGELRIFIGGYSVIVFTTNDFASPEQQNDWREFMEQKTGLKFNSR